MTSSLFVLFWEKCMTAIQEDLRLLCDELVKESNAFQGKGEHFLSHFTTQDILSFSKNEKAEKIRETAFAAWISDVLSALERTDAIGLRLGQLVAYAEKPECEAYEPAILQKWALYERYRQMLIQYIEDATPFMRKDTIWKEASHSPLLKSTHSLLQNASRYAAEFSFNAPATSVEN